MKLSLFRNNEREAIIYFREAKSAYFAWGAFAKTKQLEAMYPQLLYHTAVIIIHTGFTMTLYKLQSWVEHYTSSKDFFQDQNYYTSFGLFQQHLRPVPHSP